MKDKSLEMATKHLPNQKESRIMWLLDSIFSRQHFDKTNRQKLTNFCQTKVFPVQAALEKSSESLMHKVISVMSAEEKEQAINERIIHILIEDGCDVTQANSAGDPPLIAALKGKKIGAVKAFFDLRCDVNVVDRYGKTCLIFAAQNNDLDMIKFILTAKNISLNATDFSQHSALSYAAHNDNVDICNLLFDAGANPNSSFTSPLYLAVRNDCSLEMIKLLIEKGAAVNVWIDFTGFNTLTAAAYKNQTEAVKLLLEAGAHFPSTWYTNRSFIAVLERDNIELFCFFLEKGVNIDCNNYKGSNILHEAASHGSVKILQFLIKNTNLDLDKPDRHQKSAFYLAAEHGHVSCLKALFAAGVNGLTYEQRGMTPLEAAIFHNHIQCVLFIISHAVFPRRNLVSIYHMLQEDFDQAAFSRIKAMTTFKSCMAKMEGGHIDSLFVSCILRLQCLLGQRPTEKVQKLPLPNKIKELLFEVK